VRFHIDHPNQHGCYAVYGFDRHLLFFVEAHGKHGRHLDYDTTYGDYADLEGALLFMAKAGFFRLDDLHEALLRLEHEDEADLPPALRRVVEVVWNFKNAADPYDA
jgi:hypothetical protein